MRSRWGDSSSIPARSGSAPCDADLVDAFGDWVSDDRVRRKIMIDTPAAFYRFDGRLPMARDAT